MKKRSLCVQRAMPPIELMIDGERFDGRKRGTFYPCPAGRCAAWVEGMTTVSDTTMLFHLSDIHFGLEDNQALDWVKQEIAERRPEPSR